MDECHEEVTRLWLEMCLEMIVALDHLKVNADIAEPEKVHGNG